MIMINKDGVKRPYEKPTEMQRGKIMDNNFQVICLRDKGEWVTKGNVYTFIDGKTTYDNGMESVYYENVDDFLCAWRTRYFAPYGNSNLVDSRIRREFALGTVRGAQECTGRCDLMPLDVIGKWLGDATLNYIESFKCDGKVKWLYLALDCFCSGSFKNDKYGIALEVSKGFEDGAKKYGENNWQNGIPTHYYIDSVVKHYLKFLNGDKNERHDREFIWNLLCCIWTCDHMPELNDYKKEGK